MLIILTFGLVIASILVLCVKKSTESRKLFGLCLSLMMEICGVMIFIAKKGGISQEVLQFLYFSKTIQTKIQYFLITLNQLGYLIALGRTLFPCFLITLAMNYSMIPILRKNLWIQRIVYVLPGITLVLYYPPFYRMVLASRVQLITVIQNGTLAWITLYLILSLLLLVYEYRSITMKFCKWQFIQISVCMVALTGIYILYYHQDPGQVYHFYGYFGTWNKGLGYMQIDPSVGSYALLVAVSIICSILGFYSVARYTRGNFENSKEEVVMERKFDTAKVGASMFVHSMKNQLLSSKVIYKRISQLYEEPELDIAKLKKYVDDLEQCNNTMLLRMEELYRCVKSNAIYMVPVHISEIADNAVERFHTKYPEVSVHVEVGEVKEILADKTHLCEALYNLLINAEEAIIDAGRADEGKITLRCHNERLYTVIEVKDNGKGMSKSQAKKSFEPFYSSKNSNSNWGMGLYYVRETVKSHLGTLRIESKEGVGSSCYILLPKYQ